MIHRQKLELELKDDVDPKIAAALMRIKPKAMENLDKALGNFVEYSKNVPDSYWKALLEIKLTLQNPRLGYDDKIVDEMRQKLAQEESKLTKLEEKAQKLSDREDGDGERKDTTEQMRSQNIKVRRMAEDIESKKAEFKDALASKNVLQEKLKQLGIDIDKKLFNFIDALEQIRKAMNTIAIQVQGEAKEAASQDALTLFFEYFFRSYRIQNIKQMQRLINKWDDLFGKMSRDSTTYNDAQRYRMIITPMQTYLLFRERKESKQEAKAIEESKEIESKRESKEGVSEHLLSVVSLAGNESRKPAVDYVYENICTRLNQSTNIENTLNEMILFSRLADSKRAINSLNSTLNEDAIKKINAIYAVVSDLDEKNLFRAKMLQDLDTFQRQSPSGGKLFTNNFSSEDYNSAKIALQRSRTKKLEFSPANRLTRFFSQNWKRIGLGILIGAGIGVVSVFTFGLAGVLAVGGAVAAGAFAGGLTVMGGEGARAASTTTLTVEDDRDNREEARSFHANVEDYDVEDYKEAKDPTEDQNHRNDERKAREFRSRSLSVDEGPVSGANTTNIARKIGIKDHPAFHPAYQQSEERSRKPPQPRHSRDAKEMHHDRGITIIEPDEMEEVDLSDAPAAMESLKKKSKN